MKYFLVTFLTFLVSSVPAMAEELSVQDFKSRVEMMHSHAWFKGFYYLGSDDSYHHFVEKWDYRPDPEYEVRIDALEVTGAFQAGLKEVCFSSYGATGKELLFSIGDRSFYLCE